MESVKGKLDMTKEELEAFYIDPDSDSTYGRDLGKLLSEVLHTCIRNAIKKITEKGYTEEAAEHVILTCGPFHGPEGNLESNIVEHCLLSLKSNKKYDDSTYHEFQDINKVVDFMILEMVTMLRDIKPTLSVGEAIWSLLMCDLSVYKASVVETDLQQMGTSPDTESKHQETVASNAKRRHSQISKPWKTDDTCNCRNWCSVATHRRDAALRQKATLLLEKPYKGRIKGLKKKFPSLKDLSFVNKQLLSSSSSSCEQNKNTSFPLQETEEKPKAPPKAEDNYLKSIPCDEKGEYMPQDENDRLRLDAVAQIQALQKELQSWDDWATSKVMEVTKRLSQHQQEVKMLKAEKEEAEKVMKDNEAMEENTAKRLLETTRSLNTTNHELNVATSTIDKLRNEQSVIEQEMEMEMNRSVLEARRLEQALIKEEEALKKSQSFGSEKTSMEEELKVLRRQVGQKQREIEKAKCLLTESEIRVAKEERETAKVVKEAESIKNERERVEALAMAEYVITKEKAEEGLKKYETEKKRIEYEIAALKLEAKSKRIDVMQKSMNMTRDSSKRLEGFRDMSQKKKKKDRECVMCLDDEMTVVFIPCGHKVLCEECSMKHEERMNECPSCRTPIQKRIHARYD